MPGNGRLLVAPGTREVHHQSDHDRMVARHRESALLPQPAVRVAGFRTSGGTADRIRARNTDDAASGHAAGALAQSASRRLTAPAKADRITRWYFAIQSRHMTFDAATRSLPPRSMLFVPASRPDMIGKAAGSQADAICIDLEDSVTAEEKIASRA